jgi:uncharacterized DUF497 family protein
MILVFSEGCAMEREQGGWSEGIGSRRAAPLSTTDEVRSMVIGKIEGNVWSGIITYRVESVRIISVRRSRKEEIAIYES